MPEYSEDKPDVKGDDAILATSKKRFELCQEAEKDLRELALDDLKFRAGEQWPETIKNQRQVEKRPCLTVNVLPARERQILNDQRQNRPAIKVSPVDDKGDPETAEIIQGIVRHIEYDSNADVAYDTAFASATRIGFGYIRLLTEEEDGQQVIKIKRVPNPFQIYMDPSCEEPDYSDANFAFIVTTLTKDEYRERFPDSELAGLDDWKSVGDKNPGWLDEDSCRIAEYFYKKKSEVKWCLHNAVEVLEKTDWQGRWIPIVPVLGDELIVDGKKVLEGIVRWAKDPMRMKNVTASAAVEAIMLAPKAPWLAAIGQTEDFAEWKTANTQNHAVLRYKPVSADGKDVGPPQRIVQEPAIQAIGQTGAYFDEAVRDVMGIYEAQYGAKSQERSGKAIDAKKKQGETANFNFVDNLTRALRFLGRQVIGLIPKIYNQATAMRIIGEDGSHRVVKVNQKFDGGNGVAKIYDLTTGRYDVIVSSGPNYATKRQEAVQSMIEMSNVFPKLPEIAGDLLVGSMDWPNHEKVAERIKKTLPPGLADDDTSDPKVALQQMQGQLRQAGQQIELLSKANTDMLDVIQNKKIEQEGKKEITEMQEVNKREMFELGERTKIVVANISAQTAQLKMEHEQWMSLHGSATTVATETMKQSAAQGQQASQQEHEAGMQAGQQEHEAGMAERGHEQTLEQQQQAADLEPEPVAQ